VNVRRGKLAVALAGLLLRMEGRWVSHDHLEFAILVHAVLAVPADVTLLEFVEERLAGHEGELVRISSSVLLGHMGKLLSTTERKEFYRDRLDDQRRIMRAAIDAVGRGELVHPIDRPAELLRKLRVRCVRKVAEAIQHFLLLLAEILAGSGMAQSEVSWVMLYVEWFSPSSPLVFAVCSSKSIRIA
jgi:hypothetical protein